MITIGLDPGARGCGLSYFGDDKTLIAARYVRNPVSAGKGVASCVAMAIALHNDALETEPAACIQVVVEWPQIYTAAHSKGNPNDLPHLAAIGAAFCALLEVDLDVQMTQYLPHEWKGSIDGDECTRRIQERLSPDELKRVELVGKTLDHNIFDAVGIGLKHLGRFERHRVIAR